MRPIACLLIASFLFSGCAQYYENIATNANAMPRPVDAIGVGDHVRVRLHDGASVAGDVSQVEYTYFVVEGTVIPWVDVAFLEKQSVDGGVLFMEVVLVSSVLYFLLYLAAGLRGLSST